MGFIIVIFAIFVIFGSIAFVVLKKQKAKIDKEKEREELHQKLTPELARELAAKARDKVKRQEDEKLARKKAKSDEQVFDKITEINDGILYQVNEFANECRIGYIKARWEGFTPEQISQVLKHFSDRGFTIEERDVDGVKKDCILWEKKEETK